MGVRARPVMGGEGLPDVAVYERLVSTALRLARQTERPSAGLSEVMAWAGRRWPLPSGWSGAGVVFSQAARGGSTRAAVAAVAAGMG